MSEENVETTPTTEDATDSVAEVLAEEPETEEGEDGGEETEGEDAASKGPKKLTIEERQEELRAQIEERRKLDDSLKAREEALLQREQELQKPKDTLSEEEILRPIPIDQINAELAQLEDRISDLRAEGKMFEASRLEKYRMDAISAIEERMAQQETLKTRKATEQQENERIAAANERITRELGAAAEAIRQANGIDRETFQAGEKWLTEYFAKHPVEAAKFQEKARYFPYEAVEGAVKLAMEQMGKPAQETIEKRNAAKANTLSATATASKATRIDLYSPNITPEQFAKLREDQLRKSQSR